MFDKYEKIYILGSICRYRNKCRGSRIQEKKKQKEAVILKDVYLYPNSSLSNFEQGNVQRYRRYVISSGD